MYICPFLSFWWLSVDLAVHQMETRKLRGIHFNWWLPLEKDEGLNRQESSCCSVCCTSWTHFCWDWLATISGVFLPQNPGLYRASFLYIVLDPCWTLVKNYFLSMIVNGVIMDAIWMFVLGASLDDICIFSSSAIPSLFLNFNDLIFCFCFFLISWEMLHAFLTVYFLTW